MPELSIVIPVFNCLGLTQACLKSLEETVGSRKDLEIILVDDASIDGTAAWLATLPAPRYRVICHATNRGYATANNAAAKVASGRDLLLLNNDTVLMPGWLEPMLRVLDRAPNAGVVGNIQREAASGLIDHVGVLFTFEGIPVHVGNDTASPPAPEYSPWPAVTGACCVMRRERFLALGGFDENFRNGHEDIDFCLKMRASGRQNYVANRSIIYHHVSASPGRRDHDKANFAYFLTRWEKSIATLGAQRLAFLAAREFHLHGRRDGWRYLRKHAAHPWRYNLARLRSALRGVISRPPMPANTKPFFIS